MIEFMIGGGGALGEFETPFPMLPATVLFLKTEEAAMTNLTPLALSVIQLFLMTGDLYFKILFPELKGPWL